LGDLQLLECTLGLWGNCVSRDSQCALQQLLECCCWDQALLVMCSLRDIVLQWIKVKFEMARDSERGLEWTGMVKVEVDRDKSHGNQVP
jgi:hypothetical protein